MPKPMIPVGNKTLLEYSLEPFDLEEANVIFIVKKQHILDFSIDQFLLRKFGDDIKIVVEDRKPEGALYTCMLAKDHTDDTLPLVIYTPDVYVEPKFDIDQYNQWDGALLTFKANSPDHSYVKIDESGIATETKEKEVISELAAVGLYYFRDAPQFFEFANIMIGYDERLNGEFYICPLYNYLIKEGLKIATVPSTKLYVLGTPSELEFYDVNAFRDDFCIGVCSDHSGFHAKEMMIDVLKQKGIKFVDYGTFSDSDCDYGTYVKQAAIQLKKGAITHIFGTCRTGQGVNICGNKIDDVRSGVVYDEYSCEHAIRHNCCNMFSFPAKDLTAESFAEYIEIIRKNTFDGGRHYTRIAMK